MEQNIQPIENNTEIKLDGEGEPIISRSENKGSKKNILLIIIVLISVSFIAVFFFVLKKDDSKQLGSEASVEVVKDEGIIEVEIDKNSDSDQDKLPDYLERIIGTDEKKSDTDGDSYDDFEEIKNGYNPLTAEKYKEEEWEVVKEMIKGEDEGLFGNIFEKRDVLTMSGTEDYANRLVEVMFKYDAVDNSLITYNNILVTSDSSDDMENQLIEGLSAIKIRKSAKEVTQEDRELNNFVVVGSPDTNDFLREIYNKALVVNVVDDKDINVNNRVMKFAKNPWNKDLIITIWENNYSPGEIINIKGRIIVEEVDNFYHVVINTDENESYALVANFEIKDDNLVQFDGNYVEINGYRRIRNSKEFLIEESLGVMNIKVID